MKSSKVFMLKDFDELSDLVEKVLTDPSISRDEKKQIRDTFDRTKIARKKMRRVETTIERDLISTRNIKIFLSTANLTFEERSDYKRQIKSLDAKISKNGKKIRILRDNFLLYAFNLEEKVAKFLERS